MSNITPFVFEGHDVTVISDDDGSLHFIAMEIAEVLDYSDAHKLCERLDEDEKQNRQIRGFGNRGVIVISESGLYSAILGSTKPQAKPFQKWVRSEVLPSIRKTGSYSMAPRDAGALLPATYADALRALADKVEETQRIETERDKAIATKAEIGSRREATAMATASAKSREVARLQHELGRNSHHATMIAVEKASGRKFGDHDWRPLKKYCKEHDLHPETVPDNRWGESKAWPAAAWHAVYGIDLRELFPSAELEAA